MSTEQGELSLLDDPVAQEPLHSTNLARLAYTWRDGTPRVVPIWFHRYGETIVLGSPPNAPKVNVLPNNAKVALTIATSSPTIPCSSAVSLVSRRLRGLPLSMQPAPSGTSVQSRGANG
jgi:nitroimidazol reductase NimA-like FMN-containing flavoprotein (pyridoxamine 5'-phosphate oxidase superfamily)